VSAPVALVYVLVAVIAARPIAGHLAYKFRTDWHTYRGPPTVPTTLMWGTAIAMAACVAAAWPLVLAWAAAGRLTPSVGAEREAVMKRREADLREQRIRLERAERAAGLEPWEMGN
jgi:hypothetical protein